MLGKPADRSALPGRIPAFDKNRNTLPIGLYPALKTDQLDLQLLQFLFIQQRLAHVIQIDILALDQLQQPAPRIHAPQIVFGQGSAHFTD